MSGIKQQQRNDSQQIIGFIQNFRNVATSSGKPMAVFMVGTIPAKCFDATVATAHHWACAAKKVLVNGHFSDHDGTIELVVRGIDLAPSGWADSKIAFSAVSYAETAVGNHTPMRESSAISENLSGSVSSLKTVATRSGLPMITFKVGDTFCKAIGEIATAIQKTEGKYLEVSGRQGRFRGVNEYAIEIVKTIDSDPVDLRNSRSIAAGQHTRKTIQAPEVTNQDAEREAYELYWQKEIESDRWINRIPAIDNQPDQDASTSDAPSRQTPTAVKTQPIEEPSNEASIAITRQCTTSPSSVPEPETLVDQWTRRFRHLSFPDHELEYEITIGFPFVQEAARRVLEERAKQRAEDILNMPVFS